MVNKNSVKSLVFGFNPTAKIGLWLKRGLFKARKIQRWYKHTSLDFLGARIEYFKFLYINFCPNNNHKKHICF